MTGIDADATSAHHAAAALAAVPGASVHHTTWSALPEDSVDLVTLVAVLHHLPLQATLITLRRALRPGGRLVVVGTHRETSKDGVLSLVSLLLNPLIGLLVHPRPAAGFPAHMLAPTAPAQETYEQVARTMRAELPGVRIRRGLFWRYVAVWTAPATAS
ncbi:class I SAM-dependent methyltransferase [Quadrisphaera sp. KR29]|uniref:class I SAM-dependent methyltransferase n=1 Tax=Quadrisphaera sp. KR29 TaxID=3461391 RepID=UPI004043BD72